MELTLAGPDDGGWTKGLGMKGEPMMDERKLGMECARRGKTLTQRVVDRHAMTGPTQLAIVTDTSAACCGVPVYKLLCNVMRS